MPDERIWYLLQHTRGPAAPEGEDVFDQPGIAEHYAFLQRRAAAGQPVATGVLDVVVRPWQVVLSRD